jgi:hypothetical protein
MWHCCNVPLEWADVSQPWADHKIERAECVVCDTIYECRGTGSVIYVMEETGFACFDCHSPIRSARVAHPIHDGPFPLSGFGRCEYEIVPYCPRCETEPSSKGSCITTGPKIWGTG